MVLEAVVLLGLAEHVGPLARGLSESLSKNQWLSTQETAYALLALAKAVTDPRGEAKTAFSFEWTGGASTAVTSASPDRRAPARGRQGRRRGSSCATPAPRPSTRGSSSPGCPPVGTRDRGRERPRARGAVPDARRQAARPVPPRAGDRLQGGGEGDEHRARGATTRNVALSHVVASGWEIRNDRLDPSRGRATSAFEYQDVRDDRVYTYFDLRAGETKTVEVAPPRRLPRPLLPADGDGRGHVRRDAQRPGEGAVGRGGGAGPVA